MSARLDQAPIVVVLAVVAGGLALVADGHWRLGALVVGCAVVLAAVLRAALAPARAGWLVVRSRAFDVVLLLLLGSGITVLAVTIPRPL